MALGGFARSYFKREMKCTGKCDEFDKNVDNEKGRKGSGKAQGDRVALVGPATDNTPGDLRALLADDIAAEIQRREAPETPPIVLPDREAEIQRREAPETPPIVLPDREAEIQRHEAPETPPIVLPDREPSSSGPENFRQWCDRELPILLDDSRGLIILLPDAPRPFSNNGEASLQHCTHFWLIIAIGSFTAGQGCAYYRDMVAGRTTTLNARITMSKVHRNSLQLLLPPDSDIFKMRKCSTCENISLRKKRCSKCTAHYCTVLCQRCDWPEHRPQCKEMNRIIFTDRHRTPHAARQALYKMNPLCPTFRHHSPSKACELLKKIWLIPAHIIRDGTWVPDVKGPGL